MWLKGCPIHPPLGVVAVEPHLSQGMPQVQALSQALLFRRERWGLSVNGCYRAPYIMAQVILRIAFFISLRFACQNDVGKHLGVP